jgi:hypothetical protein
MTADNQLADDACAAPVDPNPPRFVVGVPFAAWVIALDGAELVLGVGPLSTLARDLAPLDDRQSVAEDCRSAVVARGVDW